MTKRLESQPRIFSIFHTKKWNKNNKRIFSMIGCQLWYSCFISLFGFFFWRKIKSKHIIKDVCCSVKMLCIVQTSSLKLFEYCSLFSIEVQFITVPYMAPHYHTRLLQMRFEYHKCFWTNVFILGIIILPYGV